MNNAFAVDVLPAAVVFAEGNTHSGILCSLQVSKRTMRQRVDDLFREVADLVFRGSF